MLCLASSNTSFLVQLDSGGWLHGTGSVDGAGASSSYDSALAILDGLAQPLLDPFVEGLKVCELSAYLQSLVETSFGPQAHSSCVRSPHFPNRIAPLSQLTAHQVWI